MNLKSTLKASHLFGVSLNRKVIYPYKSFSFFIVAFLVVINFLPAKALPEASERFSYSTKIVKSFNEKIINDLTTMPNAMIFAPCPGGSGVIGGKAFQDFNYNGLDDQIGGGIAGIEVYLYACDATGNSQAADNTTTDADGTYFFSGLADGTTYRVEFIVPAAMNFLQSGFNGADSRTTVQFVNSPSCDANIGLAAPGDFCEADPDLAIPCYVNGDPLAAGSGSADEDALVFFKRSFEGGNPKPTVLATAAEIGATWGTAYNKASKTIYTSAFLKRHVGFGPLGIGGIYKIDLSGDQPETTPFIDVNSIGINVGNYPSNSQRGLTANINLPNNDTQAFDEVGKKGIGGMCMANDGSKLYIVNITEKKLHSIDVSGGVPTSGDVASFNIPNPNCSGGEFRPYAVRMNNGKVYVGGVCDAEGSGNKSDLRAIIYRLDGNNFTEVLNFSLDYTKGFASRSCDDGGWFPWTNQVPEACFMSGNAQVIVHPTPHLTAFEFDDSGNLILGFTDRMGNQLGFLNYGPTGTTALYSVFTGGDILKAGANPDGSFSIENNGSAGGNTTSGVDNGEGPGGGEFYNWDVYDIGPNIPRPHSETAQGGLASIKGSGEVISTALDPFGTSVNSGGVNYFNNQTGTVRNPGYRVFRSGSSSPASFSKANGLGDLVALCGEAPIEIGGRLWLDVNENGIQDPCEQPFSGVEIALYAMDGQVTEIVTSDVNGEYYFNGSDATVADITPNTDYYVVIGFGSQFDNFNNALLDSFFLTTANTGMGQNPDLNDSDGMTTPSGILDGVFEGWPSIMVTTGNVGEVTHDNDAGFIIDTPDPQANITGFVWNDLNENGLQNDGELGIPGVTVSLFASNNTFIASTPTDANGDYIFENITGKNYYLVFDASGDAMAGDNFEVTLQDVGSDEDLDSDISQTDSRVDFEFEPINGNVAFDAGFTLPVSQVVGFVFNDTDEDGLQGNNEAGIDGVTITLFNADGTEVASTTSDANGNYTFDNIMEGDFYIVVDVSTNTAGIPNFEGTQQDAGDDDFDSDVNPNTGQSEVFSHDPAVGNSDIDAGFIEPGAQIIGSVFNDIDEDGLQGNGDGNIGGVTITLFDANGTEIAVTTSDANGNYSFDNIKEGDFYIVVDASTNTAGIPNFEGTPQDVGNDDAIDSDVNPTTGQSEVFSHNPTDGNTDIDAGFIEPISTITGFVWNDLNENGLQNDGENGIPGVTVNLLDGDGNQVATTTTDANGNYSFSEVKSDNYELTFDASNDPVVGDNFEVTLQDVGSDERFDSDISQTTNDVSFAFNAAEGNADYDAGFTLPLANIMGIAFNDVDKDGLQGGNEPMIGGVTVTLFESNNTPINSTTTDGNGNYAFNEIMSGSYYIVFDVSTNTANIENYLGTIQDAGDDDFDSDVDPNTGRTNTFNFNPSDGNGIYDAGYFEGTGSVTGSVFNDLNENGLQDPNEPGIGGVKVTVIAPDGTPINTSTSNEDGSFEVDGIPSGTVTVLFDPDDNSLGIENLTPTEKDVNNNQNDDIDSDINPNKEVDPFEFNAVVGADVDAGFIEPVDPVMIGDFVFKDCNENGVQDPGEKGIPNVPITLRGTDNLGAAVEMQMTTNSMGAYTFTVGRPGIYTLDFDIPEGVTGLEFSPKNKGNSTQDSDVNPLSGVTDPITLASGEANLTIDAGVIDNSPPLIFNVPPDVTVECNDIPTPPSSVKGVDNCDPSIEVLFSERIVNAGSCPYMIERIWTAADDCGNEAVRTQTITVTDTEAPVITIANPMLVGIENGGEVIFNCDDLPEFTEEDVNATDNCSDVEVKFVDLVREQGDCEEDGFIVKMTCGWVAEDDCGNRSEFNIVIFVVDTKSPTLQNIPEDLTINLDEGQFIPPVGNTVTATDNCDEYVRIEFEETQTAGVCGYEINRTWKGYDDCGNKAVETQKITLLEDCTCPDELVSNTLVWDAACDGSVGGMITLDLTADINKYAITITPNVGSVNFVGNMFTDLPPGDYTIMVNYDAIEDCSETYNLTIATATPSTIEVVSQTDADCDTANGTITLSPASYTYVWSDGGTGAQRNDLAAGAYTVTFTDANNCEGTQTINITNPENCECIDFSVNLLWEIMPTCNGYTNGQVDVEIIGGTAPFTYLWHDGQTTKDLFGVTGGPYSLTVTDAAGCTATLTGELGQPDPIIVMETLMNGACGEKGAIDIFVSGGTAPYTYAWSSGEITEDLTNLITGTYTITVTDANSCEGNLTVTVDNSGDITVDLSSTTPDCNTDNNGSITAMVTGGQNPLTYQWSNGATTSSIDNVAAGTYAVMVTDATGCSAMAELTLDAPGNIMVNLVASTPECGATTGNITLEATGGTTPYTYSWSNNATTKDINNLAAGNYEVTITDANGCTGTAAASVSLSSAIMVSATTEVPACDGENGSIVLEVSGGQPSYTYEWNTGETIKDLMNIAPGNYSVTITDANGCTTTLSAAIESASGLTISNSATSPACVGDAGGSIMVDISGGVAPYTYAWTDGATTKDIANLMPDSYTLTVTDANGCIITTTAVLEVPTNLSIEANVTTPACTGMAGSIDISVSGGAGNYTYAWGFGATTEDVGGLSAGNYTITVMDANGCQMTNTSTIVIPTGIEGTAAVTNPDCVGEGGQIDLTVSGGTAPYTYNWTNGATSEDLMNITPGDYTVTITDANDCTTSVNAVVGSTAGLAITENITDATCAGLAGGSITISVSGGTAPYAYSWTNGATTKDINDLMSGAYSVVITDANGCQLMDTYSITAPSSIEAVVEVDNPDCSDGTGKVNITVSGGMTPYTFAWSNGATTEDLNEVLVGTYQGTITDASGCTFIASAMLTAPAALSASFTTTDQDCSGDGNIDLTVSGGTSPYNYVWSNGATTEDLNRVGGGTYTVVISDANNCKLTQEVTVQSTGGIQILVSGTAPTCPGDSDGTLSLNVQGGTLPYAYQWSNGSQAAELMNISAGSYMVTVTDAKGCSLVGPAVLDPAPTIDATATPVNPTCAEGSGSIDLVATGGVGNLTYLWTNGATTEDINNLTAGGYTVTITDENGCTTTATAVVVIPTTLTVTATATNPDCEGTEGNISLSVTGGTAPYTYSWSNGSFEQNLSGIAAGTYMVTVADANGCQATASASIDNITDISVSITSSGNPTCVGNTDGFINLSVSGGTAPYTYSWTNGATTANTNDLAAGTYTVTVTDVRGCSVVLDATLAAPTTLNVEVNAENPTCADGTGEINVIVTGGTPPYTYSWTNGATTANINNLTAGGYTLTVIDANGCTTTATATITIPTALVVTAAATNPDCNGTVGNISLSVAGGTAPYTYSWSNGSSQQNLSGIAAGTYMITVSDANGCQATASASIDNITDISVTIADSGNPTCVGNTDGFINLSANGGTTPYTYAWTNGANTANINGLAAGTYTVTVTDARGCNVVSDATLAAPTTINVEVNAENPTCSEGMGKINLTVTGGTPPYTYNWTNGATTTNISNLTAGGYTVTITDANGCTTTATAIITIPTAIAVTATAMNPSCDGTIGNISLSAAGGIAPYTYSWSNGSSSQNLTNVAAGNYMVTVVDANGCQATANASIDNIANISVTIDGSASPTCTGNTDGFINLSVTGGTRPYTYVWTNGATTEDINGLAAGIYAVTVSDARDCKIVLDALLEAPTAINISVKAENPACPGENGNINVTVMGGTPPYRYSWNNGATTQDLSNILTGNYQVVVTDANGCNQSSPNINIGNPADFTVNLNSKDVRCYGETNGTVTLIISGSGNYAYAWSNNATAQNLANLGAGTYRVTVTNEKGCQKVAETVVNIPPAISLGMNFTNPQCPSDLGAINIDVAGGTPPYSYAWSNGATTEDVSNLPAAKYTVVVTDANGCSLEGSATIRPAAEIIASTVVTNQSCTTGDGAIDLSVSGGSGTYSYVWNTGAIAQDLSNLMPGTYEVTITDTKGCFITQRVAVGDNCVCPSPLVNQNMVTNAKCGEANGAIMIMVNGDVNQYQFQWTPNIGTAGVNQNERTNLPAGTYDILVTYANKAECRESLRLVVGNKDGLSGSIYSNVPAKCDQNNGQVILTPGVTYFWPDGSQSQNRNDLAPGAYTIKTIDPNGCESSLIVTVTQETCNVTCTLSATISSIKNPDCNGNLGSIGITITGGTAPYTYAWSSATIGNNQHAESLMEGNYSVVITDANGCSVSLMAMLIKPDCNTPVDPDPTNPDPDPTPSVCDISLSLETNYLTCDGANDGSIKANILNGVAPYTYKWSNGATTETISNLSPGEYWVEVTDGNGCRANTTIRVESPGRLVVSETRTVLDCQGVEIKINVSGGRAPYKWECHGSTGSLLNPLNLTPGTYNCVITDGSGCTVDYALVIEDYQPLGVTGVVKNTSCGQEDGSIDLTVTGGTAPYTFNWDCGLFHDEDQFNLGAHTYNVTVTDATNCVTYGKYTIEDCSGEVFGFTAVEAISLGNQAVQLTWETANENRVGNYIVYHSTDGENFEVIGFAMEGKGPIQKAEYEMEEQANFGTNYYQVKYLDSDGNEYFSEIIAVVVQLSESTGRTSIPAIVYPNPTYDEFTLDFAKPIEEVITVTITDMDGVVVEEVELQPGTPKQVFETFDYEAGVYNITVQQRRKKLKTYRLIKAVE